jgi:hypothetical protein
LVTWYSPLEKEDFREYRDWKALEKAGIAKANLKKPLEQFWPARTSVGCVGDYVRRAPTLYRS